MVMHKLLQRVLLAEPDAQIEHKALEDLLGLDIQINHAPQVPADSHQERRALLWPRPLGGRLLGRRYPDRLHLITHRAIRGELRGKGEVVVSIGLSLSGFGLGVLRDKMRIEDHIDHVVTTQNTVPILGSPADQGLAGSVVPLLGGPCNHSSIRRIQDVENRGELLRLLLLQHREEGGDNAVAAGGSAQQNVHHGHHIIDLRDQEVLQNEIQVQLQAEDTTFVKIHNHIHAEIMPAGGVDIDFASIMGRHHRRRRTQWPPGHLAVGGLLDVKNPG
mmetsp:Transcript_46868/g.106290  ORF Transcript_46868/g.106290 Transcript_46868/m.106290 type:complete len:275 (-) Transcript_46868:768-1592(-)